MFSKNSTIMATSIKKIKFDGMVTTSLGYPNSDYSFDDGRGILNKQGRKMVMDIINWLRQDYKENGDKIGTIKAQYYFEPFKVDLGHKTETGGMMFDGTNMGNTVYELVLEIYVPLTGMSFDATDVHTYRYNIRHNEFEHESTEVY